MANEIDHRPASAVEPVKAPPHPLDGKWFTHQHDQVYGPYSGHDLKNFASEGIIDGGTSVLRQGNETWTKASDDPLLARIFKASRPAPPPLVTAAPGATVVQVTNQISTPAAIGFIDEGPFGPKSPGVALLLSFLLCGVGQMYNGQVLKGILMLIGCIFLWFVFLGWIVNLWSWIDAYQTAKTMNARYRRRIAMGLPI